MSCVLAYEQGILADITFCTYKIYLRIFSKHELNIDNRHH